MVEKAKQLPTVAHMRTNISAQKVCLKDVLMACCSIIRDVNESSIPENEKFTVKIGQGVNIWLGDDSTGKPQSCGRKTMGNIQSFYCNAFSAQEEPWVWMIPRYALLTLPRSFVHLIFFSVDMPNMTVISSPLKKQSTLSLFRSHLSHAISLKRVIKRQRQW